MKCIVLAAGYATRLYPLTKDRPKSLLPVGGSTILEFLIKKIEQVEDITGIFIVTNERFLGQFNDWAARYRGIKEVTVLSDGTTDNSNRLGAIADIQFAICSGSINEDILVMAGDNLFHFSLNDFAGFFRQVDRDCITAHEVADHNALRRTGVIEVDEQQRVIAFEEKPLNPKSNLAVPPFYIYKQETLPLIKEYLDEGNNPDAPGNFLPWLIKRKEVYVYKFAGERYDIGTVDSYQQVCRIFGG
ncbi:MAG: nucleotidyltransferase family protein [Negativicutes bacterium]|nr:nucleotidyltransferase family protein [Negativicutes bacterium]